MNDDVLPASFRDPSGFLFQCAGVLFRQVNRRYAEHFERLMGSGLYDRLVVEGLLIAHQEVEPPSEPGPEHLCTLRPEPIAFVSYPYEWCFGQLKAAALLTLRVQQEALTHGMILKDASAYNVQFHEGRPVLIDTLSFECYREGQPWQGYRQFCQHFLAPLALMSRRDVRLGQLLRVNLDGIPLDLATSLLRPHTLISPGLFVHLWLHSRFQRRYAGLRAPSERKTRPIAQSALVHMMGTLEGIVQRLDWQPRRTEWADYYGGDSYEAVGLEHKRRLVGEHLEALRPRFVWDLGANTGMFSRVAAECSEHVIAFDADPACVERNYREILDRGERNLLPLLIDLVNPSPPIGWANQERLSFMERPRPEAVLALALVHHLAIANNLPLRRLAGWLAELAPSLVIEFVPKNDPKVQILLAGREDVFPDYTREGFEAAFRDYFEIEAVEVLQGSERALYRMHRH
jgi:ribosomal protein L11 methylase PrmA